MKTKLFKLCVILFLITLCLFIAGCGFVQAGMVGTTPGFLEGIWHGLLAPYTLILRFFMNIDMYAASNTGFGYDAGFLIGIVASLPIGWIAVIISLVLFFVH